MKAALFFFKEKPEGYAQPVDLAALQLPAKANGGSVRTGLFFSAKKNPRLFEGCVFVPCHYLRASRCINSENERFQMAGFSFVRDNRHARRDSENYDNA